MAQRFNEEYSRATPPDYNTCFERGLVKLMQHKVRKNNSFAVQYGKQLDHHLNYADAAKVLGQVLLHQMCLDLGTVDNERD